MRIQWLARCLGLALMVGMATPALAAPSAKSIARDYNLEAVTSGGARWRSHELAELDAALAALSDRELRALAGVRMVRGAVPRHPRESGLYTWDRRGRRITLYRNTFGRGKAGPNWTIVHEVAHAIAAFPLVKVRKEEERAVSAYNDAVSTYNRLVRTYNAAVRTSNRTQASGDIKRTKSLGKQVEAAGKSVSARKGPAFTAKKRTLVVQRQIRGRNPRHGVLAEYRSVLGRGPHPTPYGRTHIRESFAESFAMFRCEPGRLKKMLPNVHRWFSDGGHLDGL